VQTRGNKVKVYTLVQVHIREVAGLEQFPLYIGTLVEIVRHFLIECIVQGLVSSNYVSIY